VRRAGPRLFTAALTATLVGLLAGCGSADEQPDGQPPEALMTIVVTSPAFGDGETIPQRFTCDSEDISPPLEFADVPTGAAELALLVEDPDAPSGTFVHWVMWGVDPGQSSVAAGEVPAGAQQGSNDFGRQGYGGPCPPPGDPHRYVFTVFAASQPLSLVAGSSADDLRRALADHTLAAGALTGRYGR
jgi:Raf kinase inhibitor-like YbhB/YbcL family protein